MNSNNLAKEIFDCIPKLEERKHHIYQLKLKDYPSEFIGKMKEFYMDNPWIHDVKQMDVRQMVMKFYHEFLNSIKWIHKYILLRNNLFETENGSIMFKQLIECEKRIQCSYGLDGMIDIVVKIEQVTNTGTILDYYMPIELKTGEEYTNYEQQVQTYIILLNGYYKQNLNFGILLNLSKKGENQIITFENKDLEHIIFSRNYFVSKLMLFEKGGSYIDLPSLNQEFNDKLDLTFEKCKICQQKLTCYGINAIFEADPPAISFEVFQQLNNQLKEANNKEYLINILNAIRSEEKAHSINFSITQIMNQIKFQLQSEGTFFEQNALNIIRDLEEEAQLDNQLTFRILNNNAEFKNKYILSAAKIIPAFNESKQQKFFISIQITVKSEKMDDLLTQDSKLIFHFKGYKYYQFYQNELIKFILTQDYYPRKREILIQGRIPLFYPLSQLENNLKQSLLYIKQKFSNEINQKQINTISKCIRAKDFALVDGNQKQIETILFYLLNLFEHSQKKVLICTQSVDNQLKSFVNILNEKERKHAARLAFYKETIEVQKQYQIICQRNYSIERYTEIIEDKLVQNFIFFCTPQFIMESQIKEQSFDYCIVNQASHLVEPLCISCVLKGKVFILFGDSEQPSLKSDSSNRLNISLFKRLQEEEIQRFIIN